MYTLLHRCPLRFICNSVITQQVEHSFVPILDHEWSVILEKNRPLSRVKTYYNIPLFQREKIIFKPYSRVREVKSIAPCWVGHPLAVNKLKAYKHWWVMSSPYLECSPYNWFIQPKKSFIDSSLLLLLMKVFQNLHAETKASRAYNKPVEEFVTSWNSIENKIFD